MRIEMQIKPGFDKSIINWQLTISSLIGWEPFKQQTTDSFCGFFLILCIVIPSKLYEIPIPCS